MPEQPEASPAPTAPPASWYPDPQGSPGSQRYWDGVQWTEHRHPGAPPAPQGQPSDSLLWGGIIGGLVLPIVGFVISIMLFAKGRGSQGVAVLLCSFVGAAIGVALLSGG